MQKRKCMTADCYVAVLSTRFKMRAIDRLSHIWQVLPTGVEGNSVVSQGDHQRA